MKHNKTRMAFTHTVVPATALTVAMFSAVAQAEKMHGQKEDTAYQERSYVYEEPQSYAEEKRNAEEYWTEFKQDSKQTWETSKEAFRDGWVEGKLETALIMNEYLNPFEIDIAVDKDIATLSGTVGSELDKELAENVAMGIEGIDEVVNLIDVSKDAPKRDDKDSATELGFSQYMDDITTTALIKTDLLTSDNVSGMDINVDTRNNIVILRGNVETEQQKELAESIAARHDDVVKVINKLEVNS